MQSRAAKDVLKDAGGEVEGDDEMKDAPPPTKEKKSKEKKSKEKKDKKEKDKKRKDRGEDVNGERKKKKRHSED